MGNHATRFLADYIKENGLLVRRISEKLNIPEQKMIPDTRESLTAEELLKLCQYLKVRPENIYAVCFGEEQNII